MRSCSHFSLTRDHQQNLSSKSERGLTIAKMKPLSTALLSASLLQSLSALALPSLNQQSRSTINRITVTDGPAFKVSVMDLTSTDSPETPENRSTASHRDPDDHREGTAIRVMVADGHTFPVQVAAVNSTTQVNITTQIAADQSRFQNESEDTYVVAASRTVLTNHPDAPDCGPIFELVKNLGRRDHKDEEDEDGEEDGHPKSLVSIKVLPPSLSDLTPNHGDSSAVSPTDVPVERGPNAALDIGFLALLAGVMHPIEPTKANPSTSNFTNGIFSFPSNSSNLQSKISSSNLQSEVSSMESDDQHSRIILEEEDRHPRTNTSTISLKESEEGKERKEASEEARMKNIVGDHYEADPEPGSTPEKDPEPDDENDKDVSCPSPLPHTRKVPRLIILLSSYPMPQSHSPTGPNRTMSRSTAHHPPPPLQRQVPSAPQQAAGLSPPAPTPKAEVSSCAHSSGDGWSEEVGTVPPVEARWVDRNS